MNMCLFQPWFPQGICLGVGLLGHTVVLFLDFKKSPCHLPQWLYQFTLPPTVQKHSLFSTPSPAFIVCRLFDGGYSDRYEGISHCSCDLHFSNNERCWASFHVFISHLYVMEKYLFRSSAHFLIVLFVFVVLSCMSCWCILEVNTLSVVSFAIMFSHSEGCLFTLFIVSFAVQKAFKFNQVPLVYFCFYFHYSRWWTIEDLAVIYVTECSAYVFL